MTQFEIAKQAHVRLPKLPRTLWLVLSALVLCLTGCSKKDGEAGSETKVNAAKTGGDEDGLRFAFVTNNSSDFWRIAEKGLKKAEKEFSVKVDFFRPLKAEVSDQQRFLEDIMVQDFDGVAISPINPDAMTPLLNKVAAKMALVTHDSDAPKSKRSAYIGTNNVEAGIAAGKAAKAALEKAGDEKGKVAIFVGRIDMANAVERKKGVEQVLSKMSGLEILPVFLDGTDRAKAKKNIEDALARYPDLVLAIGLWNYNGPAIAGAVRESSREKKPQIVCFDEEEESLQAIKDGLIYATVVQKPFEFGYQSIKTLKEIKEGKKVPEVIDTGITTVEKSNLEKYWNDLRELKK
jgi:ribose transport system substrate-binding protein